MFGHSLSNSARARVVRLHALMTRAAVLARRTRSPADTTSGLATAAGSRFRDRVVLHVARSNWGRIARPRNGMAHVSRPLMLGERTRTALPASAAPRLRKGRR